MLHWLKNIHPLRSLMKEPKFAKQTISLFIASIIGNIFSYLYLLFAGRTLGSESYGIFGSLFGIFYIFSLVGDALRINIANKIAFLNTSIGSINAIRSILKPLTKFIGIGFLIVFIIMVSAQYISSFFRISSSGPLFVLGASLLTTLILFAILGLIQGLQLFKWLSCVGYIIPQVFKLLFGVFFVYAGWGLGGMIGALFASNLVAIVIGILPLIKLVKPGVQIESRSSTDTEFMRFTVPVLLIGIIICVPTSVDVMLVTHYFSSHDAGIYNAVATMGKIVLFVPIAISLIMLPYISEMHAKGKKVISVLELSLVSSLALSGIVVLSYWFLSGILINLFFGNEYLDAAPLLIWYGIAMMFFAANYIFAQYYLAVSNRLGLLLEIIITIGEVVAIVVFHNSLFQVIMVVVIGNVILFFLNLIFALMQNKGTLINLDIKKRDPLDV